MSIQAVTTAIPQIPRDESGSGIVGKDDFLRLLVTQLRHQDPLSPQDPTEYTGQLAQFSSLEQLLSINDQLGRLGELEAGSLRLGAASYIGREATVRGDRLAVIGGNPAAVQFELSREAEQVSVNVRDENGALVNAVELGARSGGRHEFTWDGKLSSGATAPDGDYHFEVVAVDAGGRRVDAVSRFSGRIEGLSFEGGRTLVRIGGGYWPIENVVALNEGS